MPFTLPSAGLHQHRALHYDPEEQIQVARTRDVPYTVKFTFPIQVLVSYRA